MKSNDNMGRPWGTAITHHAPRYLDITLASGVCNYTRLKRGYRAGGFEERPRFRWMYSVP